MEAFPEATSIQGAYNWLLILTLLLAAFVGLLLAASYFGYLPEIDRLDGGALLVPLVRRRRRYGG